MADTTRFRITVKVEDRADAPARYQDGDTIAQVQMEASTLPGAARSVDSCAKAVFNDLICQLEEQRGEVSVDTDNSPPF